MNKGRDQLCPLWLSGVIGLGIVAALATAYPRGGGPARSLASQPPSELSVVYLEAWLRVQPNSPEYLSLLATQYINLGRWDSAVRVADRLLSVGKDDRARESALLVKLSAIEKMTYEVSPEDPRRADRAARYTGVLEATLKYSWSISAMKSLAEMARQIGADKVMMHYYVVLASTDVTNAASWQEKIGDVALAHQAYDAAALAYFNAYDASHTVDARRHYFIQALKTLASGGQVNRACDEGDKRLGADLAHDAQTLRYLIDLAQQVNRTDLVTRYARALVHLTPLSLAGSLRRASFPSSDPRASAVPIPLYRGALPTVHYLAQAAEPCEERPVAISTSAKREMAQPKTQDEYELAFKVFVESSHLDDAEDVARKALAAHLDTNVWTRRLAQVAQWNSHPRESLKYWLLYAQASDDPTAWDNVRSLAPQLDDDQAYLAAWRHDQTGDASGATDSEAGRNSLLAEYMRLGRWQSAQRLVDELKGKGDAKAQQKLLLMEVLVAGQLTYRFPPEDPRRLQGMVRYVNVLKRTTQYQWDVPAMVRLAEKADEAGAESVEKHYYHTLALADTANASKWQEKLGDAALRRQAYDEAAQDYFAAQDAAATLDDKRHYFITALKALVSGDQVARACAEGERHAGDLTKDPDTLRYLISVATQASNKELMARYARDLVKYAVESRRSAGDYSDYADYVAYAAANRVALAEPDRLQLYRGLVRNLAGRVVTAAPGIRTVAATGAEDAKAQMTVKGSDYDLAFKAFVQSNQLGEAEKLARSALEHHLDPLIWTRRLAQVAQWNNHPDVALKYWLQFAKDSGNDEAWKNVLKLAPQLNNDQAYLAALIHAADRSPSNLALQDQVVAGYERLAQPDAGMAYLKSRAKGALRRPLLERYAALADRAGYDKTALQTYQALRAAYPASAIYAMRVADLEYRRGNMSDALAFLRSVRGSVDDSATSAPYWRLYAELARQTQNDKDADFAYKHLLATGQSATPDLNAMTSFYQSHPIDAGRIAELEFHKGDSAAALALSLRYYTAARAWPRIETLLKMLTPEQQAMFHNSAPLLVARAQYYLQTSRWDAALADLRRAVQLPDADDQTRVTYLWALVDFGTDDELTGALNKWRSVAKIDSAYWGAFAAGELRIGNPARAVVYLDQQRVQSGNDPLWLMSLADAEEASGHGSEAWQIRRKAWSILQHKAASGQLGNVSGLRVKLSPRVGLRHLNPSDSLDVVAARVTLSQTYANGDYSRALLVDMLKREGGNPEAIGVANSILANNAGLPTLDEVFMPQGVKSGSDSSVGPLPARQRLVDATVKSTMLAWAISGEHNSLARAWLAREYANRLLRPANAEITLAIASDDRDALGRVLDSRQGLVPTESRIIALNQTGRTSEAETLAFRASEGAPDSDNQYETMVDTLLRDRPSAGFDVMGYSSSPLRYIQSSAGGGLKLTSRVGLQFEAIQRNQQTTDTSQLAWVPALDREFDVTVTDKTTGRDLALTVGHRNAVGSFFTALLRGEFNQDGSLSTSFAVGVNQFTDLTQQMQVGATKDMLQAGMEWNANSRWFVQGSAEADRFHAQDRTYMGRGYNLTAAIGYRFRLDYPDWTISVVGARGVYTPSNNVISSLGALLPSGEVNTAGQFMPSSYAQYGLMLGLGNGNRDAYHRSWRPFLDVGYVHDSNQGWGPQVSVGLGGSVFGHDHLRIFFVHQSAGKGTGQPVSEVGLSYRLFY